MRYDKLATFERSDAEREYNPEAGKYTAPEVTQIKRRCHVHDLGNERTVQIYGRADVRALVVHHLGQLIEADKVKIGDVDYHINRGRQVSGKATYIVSEVGP